MPPREPSSSSTPDPRSVLIFKTDAFCAAMLRQAVLSVHPSARCRLVSRIEEAATALAAHAVDLLITGLGARDGDALDFLHWATGEPRRARLVFVVSGRREHHVLASLKELAVDGMFDSSSERLEQFAPALRSVTSGLRYWSPSVLERLHQQRSPPGSICRRLTPTEQLVLAEIGDGSDDQAAALRLGLRPCTIQSIRRELHRKLGAQHKGELVRLAAQHGYVRLTPEGVIRPGFSLLLAACRSQRKRTTVASSGPEIVPA